MSIRESTESELKKLEAKFGLADKMAAGLTYASIVFFVAFFLVIIIIDSIGLICLLQAKLCELRKQRKIEPSTSKTSSKQREEEKRISLDENEKLVILSEMLNDFEMKLIRKQSSK